LKECGFNVSKTQSYACPAWLFDKTCYPEHVDPIAIRENEGFSENKLNIGLILATYSLPGGTFDAWERNDKDFDCFVMLVEHIVNEKKGRVFLISHSNGFELPPNFKRTHWRDYKMICRLYEILVKRDNVNINEIKKVDALYHPWEMHTLIGQLDMLISGRVHGAVAALEQAVPTIAFDYKNGPLAHKMSGFFDAIDMKEYVIPREEDDFIMCFDNAYDNLELIQKKLQKNYPLVKRKAEESFEVLKDFMEKGQK
jgi:colanic acid/amylovoran biosynthesis protein